MKYWEIIADNLSKAGWSWAALHLWIARGERSLFADAHRGNGKRLVARAEEKLTAFIELQSAIMGSRICRSRKTNSVYEKNRSMMRRKNPLGSLGLSQ